MSKKPNMGLHSTQGLPVSQEPPKPTHPAAAKPFDGFKTSQNTASRKPFDIRGGKTASTTEYGGQQLGVGALQDSLVKDIIALDLQLQKQPVPKQEGKKEQDTISPGARSKPKLFAKKDRGGEFNFTGETKASVGNNEDWDLGADTKTKKPPVGGGKKIIAKVEKGTGDWELEEPIPDAKTYPAKGAALRPLFSKQHSVNEEVDRQVVGTRNTKKNINMELEAQDAEFERLYECPENCGRSFRREALEKHIKICKTVFQAKNPGPGAAKQRGLSQAPDKGGEGSGQVNKKAVSQVEKESNTQKWKKDSENFRRMLKGEPALTEGEKLNMPDLPQQVCDICQKSFNDGAFSRHRPLCESKKKYVEGTYKR